MKELLEYIAKSLVDYPDDVSVTEATEGNTLILELRVNDADMGKVIGKQGRIAKSIRSVIKAASVNCGKKVNVEIKSCLQIKNSTLTMVGFFIIILHKFR